jgi:hypothetical protein
MPAASGKQDAAKRRADIKFLSALILVVGLASSGLIYWTAGDPAAPGILGYEEGEGGVYPVQPDDSKKYLRDMEVYGGRANVLMDQLRRWLSGLWQGKSLAYAVAVLSAVAAAGIYWAAGRPSEGDEGDEPHRHEPD